MYFHKHHYPANFTFADTIAGDTTRIGSRLVHVHQQSYADDVHRIWLTAEGTWDVSYSQAGLTPPPITDRSTSRSRLIVTADAGLRLEDPCGAMLLAAPPGFSFGACGEASIFMFERHPEDRFYGMGEKQHGLELSGTRTKFWNTDVWADFDRHVFTDGAADPMYVSVPYLIVKRGHTYVGLLLDNPVVPFISTATTTSIAGQMAVKGDRNRGAFWMGCDSGTPDLYIIVGPSLAELTRKVQRLVGTTPLPPAWALGYHQCRWGYECLADMDYLDANFRRFEIPCDAFWFDIEYMDGYRVFTWDKAKFPDRQEAFADLRNRGRRIVPILDPGVKREKGYAVYEDGCAKHVFCQNPAGGDFIGLVWPGETVFPDFSIRTGRDWWAGHVAAFAATGVAGAWLDMNDPATGHVDNMQMRFDQGRNGHETFHNQYALGMAMATRQGFIESNPGIRPFLLSRSGCTGSSRYTAIWTGDNCSNWHHLKGSIAMTLNLALSGIPFNGPDIGGFGGDTNASLMTAWVKAGCLFPVMRNHSCRGTMRQEPWAFDGDILGVIRDYIRLRYKLRPYLYNLFVAQEETGEAILRPLLYDFDDTAELPLDTVDDQFMVGPAIMQAPQVQPGPARQIILPAARWFSLLESRWIEGARQINSGPLPFAGSPIYLREGTIVPMVAGAIVDNTAFDPRHIELHILLDNRAGAGAFGTYTFDDGETFGYREGKRSVLEIRAAVTDAGILDIGTRLTQDGYGNCCPSFVLYADFREVRINGNPVQPHPVTCRLGGMEPVLRQVGACPA